MKLNKIIVCCIIATQISGCASIQWTKADTVRQLTVTGMLITDWVQTRNNAIDGWNEVCETNIILGSRPNHEMVDLYMLGSIIGHFAVSLLLPHKYRSYWQMFWIGVETYAITNNELVRRNN
jgi:hypothetical protein